jgi:hypothetical protein
MGLDAIVESKEYRAPSYRSFPGIVGSVKISGRNIDLVEMEWRTKFIVTKYMADQEDQDDPYEDLFRCSYVVEAEMDVCLTEMLRAHTSPVRRGLQRAIVDYEWRGKELAKVLNGDVEVKDALYSPEKLVSKTEESIWKRIRGSDELVRLQLVEVLPFKKERCVRIREKAFCKAPGLSPFPTAKTFEAFDRIACHIRSFTNNP